MKTLRTSLLLTVGLMCLIGCNDRNSQAGAVDGVSYNAFWKGDSQTAENILLLVIADYSNDKSPASGKRGYGVQHEPVPSGYIDRDGEVVSFALLQPDLLQILDQYLPVADSPIVYVYRDGNGSLAVEPVRADSPVAKSVIDGIVEKTDETTLASSTLPQVD